VKVLYRALRTSVGRKALVAASGLTFAAWCALHVLGNFATFAGPAALDGYAAWLRRGYGVPLWGMRLALAAVIGGHAALALALWRRSRAARTQRYRQLAHDSTSLSARATRWCGVGLGAFLVFHVLHVNFGLLLPGFVRGHVFANMARAFASWPMLALYLLASLLVGVHLAHGFGAALSSLGWFAASATTRRLGLVLAVPFVVGFAAAPLALGLGVLP
jgi:succinate dehydrogenase / fumarate reductase cytochrome b subunit